MPGRFLEAAWRSERFLENTTPEPPPPVEYTSVPGIAVQIAFEGTVEEPIWTDVTPYVYGYSTRRGRNDELARDEAGTASVRLNNQDRRFEPGYAGELVNLLLNPSIDGATPNYFNATQSAALYGQQGTTPPGIVSAYSVRVDVANLDDSGIAYDPGHPNRIAVEQNVYYAFSVYALGTTVQRNMSLAILWTAADGTLLSWSQSNVVMAISGSGWQRYSAAFIPPANAAYAIPHFFTNGAQGVWTFYTDAWQFEVAVSGTWVERLDTAERDFEGASVPTGYSVFYEDPTATLAVGTTLGAVSGSKSLLLTPSGSTVYSGADFFIYGDPSLDVEPGKEYKLSVSLRHSGAVGVQANLGLVIWWYDTPGFLISETTLPIVATSSWASHSMIATAPANASYVALGFAVVGAYTLTFGFDLASFQATEPGASAYVDGDQPDGTWDSTPHASTSYRGGSPYYPNLLPFRRFRIVETWDDVPSVTFDGYVEDWPLVWGAGENSDISMNGSDGFLILSRAKLPANWTAPAELGHERLTRVLDDIGWPIANRRLELGHSLMAPVEPAADNTVPINPLEHMKAVADAEGGRLFMSGGELTFHNRHHGVIPPNDVPRVTFSGLGPAGFADLDPVFDKTKLYNEVRARSDTATEEHVAQDTASIDKYRATLSLPLDLTPLLDPNELDDAARYWVSIYSEARIRFQRLLVEPRANPEVLWPQALQRELGDRVEIVAYPPGGGSPIVQETFIQAIEREVDVESNTWTVTYQLSPYGVDYDPGALWIMDSSGDTTLGLDSVLRY